MLSEAQTSRNDESRYFPFLSFFVLIIENEHGRPFPFYLSHITNPSATQRVNVAWLFMIKHFFFPTGNNRFYPVYSLISPSPSFLLRSQRQNGVFSSFSSALAASNPVAWLSSDLISLCADPGGQSLLLRSPQQPSTTTAATSSKPTILPGQIRSFKYHECNIRCYDTTSRTAVLPNKYPMVLKNQSKADQPSDTIKELQWQQ